MFYAFKIAGACADEMKTLDEVKEMTEKALENTRTMGVAITPCILPEVGRPTFTLGDDDMEIGMGIHGEPGISREKLKTVDEIVDVLLEKIVADLPFAKDLRFRILGAG